MKWYERSRRRILLDFHIPDWDERFLSKFDPERFAECVARANATAATIMANTCTGLCNFPTRTGVAHGKWKERDIYREMIDSLHKRGIDVVMYYCTLYVDQYWDDHPEARIVDAEGKSQKLLHSSACRADRRRFSTCCPNNMEYRKFVVAQLEEICDRYDFEGVWPDMDVWPTVCYCSSCKERYSKEVGGAIPTVIDWEDPTWVRFQRKRQEWLSEFIHMVTDTLKKKKPEVTVAHQSHTYYGNWLRGGSLQSMEANDWLSADFYGEKYNESFYSKLFYSASRIKPYEHLNCWNYPMIFEHIISRTEDHLRMNVYTSMINEGAMVFINAIDPDGSLHEDAFETIGKIFGETEKYEQHLGGEPCCDVGIYYSFNSNFDTEENGKDISSAGYTFSPLETPITPSAHRNAAVNTAKILMYSHIPYWVITKKNLDMLSDFQVVVLPNLVMLDDEEIEALKAYVKAGGSIYASKNTSMVSVEGHRQADFLLSDLFGVTYQGQTKEVLTYVAPRKEHQKMFPGFSPHWPVTLPDLQLKVKARSSAEVIATLTLPYTDPTETRYASILTDPPDRKTDYASIVLNRYGRGKVVYSAGAIETWVHDSQMKIFENIIRMLASRPFCYEADAPKPVEVALFDQKDKKRYIVKVLNYQQELPNIPVSGIKLKVHTGSRQVKKLSVLPEGRKIKYEQKQGCIEFVVPELKNFLMLELGYG
jgi:hypothetical protein